MRATVLTLLLAGIADAAAPPAGLTPGQMTFRRERAVLQTAIDKSWSEGRQSDAIAPFEEGAPHRHAGLRPLESRVRPLDFHDDRLVD